MKRRAATFFRVISFLSVLATTTKAVDNPTLSPTTETSAIPFPVTVSCATPGATIRYTLTGAEPTIYDPEVVSGQMIVVRRDVTLKVKAWLDGTSSATVAGEFDVTGEIAGGGYHQLALKSNGEVLGWAFQDHGRLGNGSTANTEVVDPSPVTTAPGTPVVNGRAIAAGFDHSALLLQDGEVYGFGNNANGQVGNNSTVEQTRAVRVKTGTGVNDLLGDCVAVSAGHAFSAAVGSDGFVYAWGLQGSHRLGSGSATGSRLYAGKVKTGAGANDFLGNIVDVDLGQSHSLAREKCAIEGGTNGYVWAWGEGGAGRLGTGGTGNQIYATRVLLDDSPVVYLTDAWDVSAGENFSAIIRWHPTDPDLQGTVWMMGYRVNGRMGDNGATTGNKLLPGPVVKEDLTLLKNIIQVSVGNGHTLALDNSGNVWSWGANNQGQLGDGTGTNRKVAVAVQNVERKGPLQDIIHVNAGGINGSANVSTAIARDGTVYAWGANANAQLANEDGGHSNLPVEIEQFKAVAGFPEASLRMAFRRGSAPGAGDLVVTATDSDGQYQIAEARFYLQGVLVGTATTHPWRHSLSALTQGIYHSYAVVRDLEGNETTTLPIQIEITPNTDADLDGLPDAWETTYGLSTSDDGSINVSNGPNGDPDNDGIPNLSEYQAGTNPMLSTDSDSDGQPDDWETYWFGDITFTTSSADPDHDGVSNALELINLTDPNSAEDSDGDGLPDDWEFAWLGDLSDDGAGDPDYDGLDNFKEWLGGLDPNSNTDLNDNGLSDDWEAYWFGVEWSTGAVDPEADPDGDHIINQWEEYMGTNPIVAADSDADGLPDDWEIFYLSTLDYAASDDPDLDRMDNGFEWLHFTHPLANTDSDTDGLPDEWEMVWFGHMWWYGMLDTDGDKIWNYEEWYNGLDPASAADLDFDGMPDDWEAYHFARLQIDPGPQDDYDGDKVSNLNEYLNDLAPTSISDNDHDGMPDDWEKFHFDGNTTSSPGDDPDSDNLDNIDEFRVGTDPEEADTDGDGILDGDEDSDGDGIPNSYEVFVLSSDPTDPASGGGDSDTDGLLDGYELFYFGNLTAQGTSGDPDGDSYINGLEAILGLNPNASTDSVTIIGVQIYLPN